MTANVIIRKEKIKIQTSDEQLAFSIRKQLNDALQYDLVAMLERVFTKTEFPDVYINIEKLKIDIGVVSAKDFQQHFVKLAETKLINELQKQQQNSYEEMYAKARENENYHSKENAYQSLQPNTIKQQELTALLYFLKNGNYPWWYKKEQQKIPFQLLGDLTEEETETLLIKMLAIKESRGNEEIQKMTERLFIHLHTTKNEIIVKKLLFLYNNNTLTKNTQTLIENGHVLIQLFSISQKEFYARLFQFLLMENIEAEKDIIYNFLKKLKGDQKTSISALQEKIAAMEGADNQLSVVLNKVFEQDKVMPVEDKGIIQEKQSDNKKDKETIISDKEKRVEGKQLNTEQEEGVIFGEQENVTQNKQSDIEKEEKVIPDKREDGIQRKRAITQQEREGIYIGNCGLLLLHPFLQSFFTEAELLNEQNQFISIAAQQKAAVLLYYLQCGDEQYKEWEMALNKILCGMASDEIIPENIIIEENEKEEAKVLLQTAINYWKALKGASIEALQNTFLLREGKITWKDDYWLVQVERTGVDILLERLPWSYNIIKLPWLNNLIYTEWQT